MKIPYHQRWLLRRTNRRLRRSDPHLAAMLAIFARLYAAEAITSHEQTTWPGMRAWRHLVRLTLVMVRAATSLGVRAGRALRQAAPAGVMRRSGRPVMGGGLTMPPSTRRPR